MCGRFLLTTPARVIAELFQAHAGRFAEMGPRYNIAPSQPVLVVRNSRSRGRVLETMRWGLIPRWAKEESIGLRTINCRSETASTKPAWRDNFTRRRCLVPADGFYEWKKLGSGKKQPMVLRVRSRPGEEAGSDEAGSHLTALAGLWDRWQPPEGEPIDTCTILTTQPNNLVKDIHDRMPVVVPREDWSEWLAAETNDDRVKELCRPIEASTMEAWPVSPLVSNTRNEGEELIRRVKTIEEPGLFGA
jgi:putative SOS response-associated peptidase YedK